MARRKRNYTVRTGDTAATIAKQLGIDPQTLMRANTGASLRAGEVLKQPPVLPTATASNYALDKFGGAMAFDQPDIPPPPSGLYPPATQPITAYTQPAGHGAPTDYSQAYFGAPSTEPPLTSTTSQIVPAGYQQSTGLTDETMVRNGFIKQGNFWLRQTTPVAGEGLGAGATTMEDYQKVLYGGDTDAYRGMVQDVLGSRNFAIEDGIAYRRGPTGNITTTPISGATARSMSRPKSMGQRQARMRYVKRGGSEGWLGDDRARTRYLKWKHAQRDQEQEGVATTDADFEAWYNQVTGDYGADIWDEAKMKELPPGSIGVITKDYDYTVHGKEAFDRYSKLEASDTKLGFYDWFQESQHIFGSAAWDNAMDKTVGGEYRTDKAKAAYEAYLGYAPDWEVEEGTGSASAPRYQAGYNFDYDTKGGYTPMERRKARPGYLGLINWRI